MYAWKFSFFSCSCRYLAPELVSGGKMTEKVDVYAFGLVLLELITGQRAHDLQYCSDNQFLLDHIRALATGDTPHIFGYNNQLLDPRLVPYQLQPMLPYELQAMGYAASLCLQQDPDLRPPMSKVLHSSCSNNSFVKVMGFW